jgi:membrane protease YdiL (CAAX protease family)
VLAGNAVLAGDADVMRGIYVHGVESVSESQREGLIQRHGWFGKLALVFGVSAQDQEREAIVGAAVRTTVVLGIVFVAMLFVLGAGVVLLILGIVFLKKGRIRSGYLRNAGGGTPVYLETFALWLVVWVGVSMGLRALGERHGILVSEVIAVVFSLGVAIWPMGRGVGWRQLRADLGWNVGRGVVREIFAGLVGYVAGLPIVGVGFLVTAVLIHLSAVHPTHPIVRELGDGASALSLVGIYVAACVLAPLVEETMFRGALYGHLRRRWRPVVSAIVVSFLFAAVHPQGWAVIPLLGSVGFVLAMLREWRGSLISSMTAHALNNGFGVTIVLLLLR